MQDLRLSLSLAMEKFQSLFDVSEKELKDFKTYTVCNIGILRERLMTNETVIAEQKKTIEDLHNQILVFQTVYSTLVDIEKFKKELESKIKDSTNIHLNSLQNMQGELKLLFKSLKDDLLDLRSEMEIKLSQLTDKVNSNFYISRLDKEGVLKEIRIYEKTIFIIEKKIENIYTLIERINKRGEICHKPE
jgi:hypothetical protein